MSDTGQNIRAKNGEWKFSGDVPNTFDEHVQKSVPLYKDGHNLILEYSDFFVPNNSHIYDIGCSTGVLTSLLGDKHINKSIKIIGIDIEKDMTDKAKLNNSRRNVNYINGDFLNTELKSSSLMICYYTLQFISPSIRQLVVDKIYDSLSWGGALILFEKVRAPDARFQDYAVQVYNEFKLKNFSADNVISKSKSLKGILEPFSSQGNIDLMKRAGFKDIMTIQKYICFEGFLAIK